MNGFVSFFLKFSKIEMNLILRYIIVLGHLPWLTVIQYFPLKQYLLIFRVGVVNLQSDTAASLEIY